MLQKSPVVSFPAESGDLSSVFMTLLLLMGMFPCAWSIRSYVNVSK